MRLTIYPEKIYPFILPLCISGNGVPIFFDLNLQLDIGIGL